MGLFIFFLSLSSSGVFTWLPEGVFLGFLKFVWTPKSQTNQNFTPLKNQGKSQKINLGKGSKRKKKKKRWNFPSSPPLPHQRWKKQSHIFKSSFDLIHIFFFFKFSPTIFVKPSLLIEKKDDTFFIIFFGTLPLVMLLYNTFSGVLRNRIFQICNRVLVIFSWMNDV